ncbi:bifunctional lytic transglycosylase/C40 family peptidase [Streptomyces cinnamoneus]|uniref:C40 family peptidase n=1 Tax=Streptomyces cinnamoneus TaxID=53446 RepID=UPI0033EEE2EC
MKVVKACVMAVAVITVAAFGLLVIVVTGGKFDAEAIPGGSHGGLKGAPAEFQPWLLKASAACKHPELTPALLAAQVWEESNFSTDRKTVSYANAKGPSQFIPGTWAVYGRDDDGNGRVDEFDIGDAVMAQGRYMCDMLGDAKKSGYHPDVSAYCSGDQTICQLQGLALGGYNAGWGAVDDARGIPNNSQSRGYVRDILKNQRDYEGPGGLSGSGLKVSGTGSGPDALRKAAGRLGTPYAYGGGGPEGPSMGFCDGNAGYRGGICLASSTTGFDCSSLVQYAYWPKTQLPRTADEQYNATSHHPIAKADLQPGDLMFWAHGGVGAMYHVAMYAGDGKVLHAPRTGKTVELVPLATAMPADDYRGATRP